MNHDLDEAMNRFRLASRELFNNYFRVLKVDAHEGWIWEERFSVVEETLFQKLVVEPCSLSRVVYRDLQPEIVVELGSGSFAPIMLNRDIDSGYWDYPISEITDTAKLKFVSFFDWDQLAYRDNRYVRVKVDAWREHPETVGKSALIESQYVHFLRV